MESLQKISSKNNGFYVFIRSRPKNYRKSPYYKIVLLLKCKQQTLQELKDGW